MKNVSTMISLLRWLQPRERTITQLLGRFVRAESPSFDKAAVDCFGEMVAAEWQKRDARITRIPQNYRGDHLKVHWRSRQKTSNGQILVIGHLDTVYDVGTIARMPFRVSRGRAWGPGTFDMKGGLVIALLAMDTLVANALSPKKTSFSCGHRTRRLAAKAHARTLSAKRCAAMRCSYWSPPQVSTVA